MPNKMATMQGCCDCESIIPPCYICPCLLGDYSIDILVKAKHVKYKDPADQAAEDFFDDSMEFLTGLITLEGFALGSLPLYCTGTWFQGCGAVKTIGVRFVNDYCEGPFVGTKEAVPFWSLFMDVPNNRIYLYLSWWGVVCEVPDLPSVWASLRWTYEWPTDACEDVKNLTYSGVVEILPFGESTYVVAGDDDLIAYVAGVAGSGLDPRYVADNVDLAPDIFLNREGCDEGDCCAEEGGGPTASMDLEVDECQIHATDTSTPGTCGAIVKRLWDIEVWSENPTGDDEALACPDARRTIYGEGEDQEEIFIDASLLCGSNYFRVTLHVWDEEDCHDSVTSGIGNCCACEDRHSEPCTTPSGSLDYTLIDPEACTYELCATAPTGDGICGTGPGFVEWQLANGGCAFTDCGCVEVGEGDCVDPGCGGTLLDGACTEITITEPTTLRWRAWDAACGCFSEWTEIQLSCNICECCDEPLTGVMMTIGGFSQGDVEGCADCDEKISGTFYLPFDGCVASLSLTDYFSCECEDPCSYNLDLQVILVCSPGTGPGGVDQILIFGVINTSPTDQIDFYREVNFPEGLPGDCLAELDGPLTNTLSPGPCLGVQCDGCDATMTLDFV